MRRIVSHWATGTKTIIIILIVVGALLLASCKETGLRADSWFLSGGDSWTESESFAANGGGSENDMFGFDIDVAGQYAVIGVPYDDTNGTDEGAAYVMKNGTGGWEVVEILYGDFADSTFEEFYGSSVAIDGTSLVVGSPYYSSDDVNWWVGAAYIYEIDPDTDQVSRLDKLVGAAIDDRLGTSVDIAGDSLIVGAPQGSGIGQAFIVDRIAGVWQTAGPRQLLMLDDSGAEEFGASVSVSEKNAVVADSNYDVGSGTNQGKVFWYSNEDGSWGASIGYEDGSIDHTTLGLSSRDGDLLGTDVDLYEYTVSSTTIVRLGVTALGNNGSAYLAETSGIVWQLVGNVTDSERIASDDYGQRIRVGRPWTYVSSHASSPEGTQSGSITVFAEYKGEWSIATRLVPLEPKNYAWFGRSIGVDGETLLVGAPCSLGVADRPGVVHPFYIDG